jgi:hypothetical protein
VSEFLFPESPLYPEKLRQAVEFVKSFVINLYTTVRINKDSGPGET